jgi:5-methylcytosine-specific restriction endonuclease McrA
MRRKDKAKAAEQWQRWYAEHGVDYAAKKRAQRAANPEHYLALQRAAYQARLEEKRAYHREWQKAHPPTPQQRFGKSANQRARGYGSSEVLDYANLPLGPCVYCGIGDETVTWDHVVPLSRGGANAAWNCVRSCLTCNRRKQSRTPLEWRDPLRVEAQKARKRAYIRQWHRDHYAEVYAQRKAKRAETGHW